MSCAGCEDCSFTMPTDPKWFDDPNLPIEIHLTLDKEPPVNLLILDKVMKIESLYKNSPKTKTEIITKSAYKGYSTKRLMHLRFNLTMAGIKILRERIETYPNVIGINPIYYEAHITLEGNRGNIIQEVKPNWGGISWNADKDETIITIRMDTAERANHWFPQYISKMQSALTFHKVEHRIKSIRHEATVYDNNVDMDKDWLWELRT